MSGEPQEKELYTFGPMGVRLCFGRPGLFKTTIRNITKIVLTDKQINGVPKGRFPFFKDKAGFQVPYNNIVAIEQTGFFLNKALWIQYREAETTKEISIICDAQHVSRMYALLEKATRKP